MRIRKRTFAGSGAKLRLRPNSDKWLKDARMNQRLSDWANIAQIASGIAVVITLIVLIVGVRENTEVVRASAYANSIASLNDLSLTTLTDVDAVRVWEAYIREDTADFDNLDEQRLNLMLLTVFRTYETTYFSEGYGLIGQSEWGRLNRTICGHFGRANALGRAALLEGVLTAEFIGYMTNLCSR
jgi:hypothetical protein